MLLRENTAVLALTRRDYQEEVIIAKCTRRVMNSFSLRATRQQPGSGEDGEKFHGH